MAKQFAYRDAAGFIYPAHQALAFQPGLVPGQYDTETRTFTPTGNPRQQTGSIITDAGAGGGEKVLSGLGEDRGADTAPLGAGVAWNQAVDDPDAQARMIELEQQLEEEQQRNASLSAQVETLTAELAERAAPLDDGEPQGDAPQAGDAPPDTGEGTPPADGDAQEPPTDDSATPAPTRKRVSRKTEAGTDAGSE